MFCRGIRGATTAKTNTKEDILEATTELLQAMIDANGIEANDIACATFTTTSDINAEFPAAAARQLGWTDVALLCSKEVDVPASLPMCIRVLVLHNTDRSAEDIVHVYNRGAAGLRTDMRNTRTTS